MTENNIDQSKQQLLKNDHDESKTFFKKTICIPCGRSCFLELLAPHILESKLADEIQIWFNPRNAEDAAYIENVFSKLDPRMRVIKLEGRPYNTWSIDEFYSSAAEEDRVYLKLDDDVIWLENGGIDRVFEFREAHPEYFLVSPLVINNGVGGYLLLDKLGLSPEDAAAVREEIEHQLGWSQITWYKNCHFAVKSHRLLLDAARTGQVEELHSKNFVFGEPTRFSINAISWFGSAMKRVLPFDDDEQFLTKECPAHLNQPNCIIGDVIFSHFAFGPQFHGVMSSGILDEYRKLAGMSLKM